MNESATGSPDTTPTSCPVCHSSAIVTTAKVPNRYSYWRCTMCGEIWNALRSQQRGNEPEPKRLIRGHYTGW